MNNLKSTSLDDEIMTIIKETKTIAKIIKSGCTCLSCFITDPFLIEGHHVGGRKHSKFIVPLCANCHVLASKNQSSYDKKWLAECKTEREKAEFVISDLEFLIDSIKRWLNHGTY